MHQWRCTNGDTTCRHAQFRKTRTRWYATFFLCGQYVAVPTVCIVSLKNVSGKQAWQDRFLKDMAKYRNHTYQALLSILKPSSLPSVFDVQNGYASQYASPYAGVSLLPDCIDGLSLSYEISNGAHRISMHCATTAGLLPEGRKGTIYLAPSVIIS